MKLLKTIFLTLLFLVILPENILAYYDPGYGEGGETPIITKENEVYGTSEWNKTSFDFTTFENGPFSAAEMILGSANPSYRAMTGGGAVASLGRLIAVMYRNPPASSGEYFADLGRNLGLIKPAYAQGIGFEGLKTILPIWKTFRDLAYLFFVVVFIVVGFAIMFRMKIDPQTVISIENSLPRIVLSLLLVTFSYAIAGLLIDLIYVSMHLILSLLVPVTGSTQIDLSANIFELFGNLFGGWTGVAKSAGEQVSELTVSLFSDVGSSIFGLALNILATAIVAIAIAYTLFKLFFSLLMSYVSVIMGVIFSPLMLMFQALPGQNGFSNWLKTMLTNIIPFPVTAGVFSIAKFLVASLQENPGETWVAPFLGAGNTSANIPVLIGVGMILVTPSIIDSVKKSIGAPGIASMAGGIGGPLGVGAQIPVTFLSRLQERRKESAAKDKQQALIEQEKDWQERMYRKPYK